MISRAASVLIFLVALLGSGALLSEVRPFTGVPAIQEKFAWLAAHADDYDTLFIGTSRIYRGLNPAVFDQLTAAAGVPTHSFNFGIDAMSPPEDAYVLEHLAALRPKHLRWVFIESNRILPGVGYLGGESTRSLHWHDTARTVLELRTLLAPSDRRLNWRDALFGSQEERQPITEAAAHSRLWLTRTLNAGRGALLLRSWLAPPPRVHLSSIIGPSRDGYISLGEGVQISAADRADYERRFAERTARPAHIAFHDRDAQHNLEVMLARLRVLGARPVLMIPPYLSGSRPYPQPGSNVPILDYGDAGKWPELFAIDHRLDRSHLNAAGADLFTRAVAADFIELTGSHR